ncbi:unnamed protein product [Pelagomonas calceolata]|uniref:Uncharacterized protein n=1 Tax=Pelagomonas calceolata TaxID=35677 RepID=A0A8J2T325_9STRA|nr:unnamed protein product [Pelagomonas calceolata]
MALAAAEARAAAAEEELEVLRDALAASAPSNNTKDDNELIKALERERDAALDARDAAEEARAKAERQLSQSIDSVKDGAKGALSQLQRDAKTEKDNAVKKAVEDVKIEAKKKIAAVKEKLKAVQDFAKKRDEECKAAELKLASLEEAKATALDDVKAQLRHAQTQRDDALRQARTPVAAAPVVPQKGGDDARLRAALDALDNERDANARLRADFERYKRRSNKVLRGAKKPQGKDAGAAAADRAALVAADAAIAASRTSAAAQKEAQDAMTSAVKVAARLAHAKAAEAKRKARLAIQAAQKKPAAPPPAPATPEAPPPPSEEPEPAAGDGWGDDGAVEDPPPTPAPAPAAPAGEGWDDDDDRPEAPGLVARMLDAEISLPFFRRGGSN